jgi:hypothetical protein
MALVNTAQDLVQLNANRKRVLLLTLLAFAALM